MSKTLDRSKPYGEIYGSSSARYEQDGCLFNALGEFLERVGPAKAKAMPKHVDDVPRRRSRELRAAANQSAVQIRPRTPLPPTEDAEADEINRQLSDI